MQASLLTVAVILLQMGLAEAAEITLTPLCGQVSMEPGGVTVSVQDQMLAFSDSSHPVFVHPVMEYDLAPIPSGVTVTSASLVFTGSSPSPGILRFEGYSGNGALDPDDIMRGVIFLAGDDAIQDEREYTLSFATDYVQHLVDTEAGYFGIVATQYATDTPTQMTSPRLVLTYLTHLPEPSSLALLGAAWLMTASRRRL